MGNVRVGFIGAGSHANSVHYPSLAQCEDVELAAICDLDGERLNRTADAYGVGQRYTDYREMLTQADLDAVYVCLPPMGLKDIVVDCLGAGKHVFTEKPPGVTSEDCLAMAQAAERAGRLGIVAFNRRYAAVVRESKRRVDEVAGPIQAMAEFHKNMVGQEPYYGLSILTCDIIHVVDCLRYFLGEASDVQSDVRQFNTNWDNVFNALIRFRSGATGTLSACRAAGGRYERFELHGEGASAYIRAPDRAEIWTSDKDCELLKGDELTGSAEPRITYGYFGETRHFVDCIRSGAQPLTSFADALHSIRLCEWIQYGRPLA